jgi:hypothetical protein
MSDNRHIEEATEFALDCRRHRPVPLVEQRNDGRGPQAHQCPTHPNRITAHDLTAHHMTAELPKAGVRHSATTPYLTANSSSANRGSSRILWKPKVVPVVSQINPVTPFHPAYRYVCYNEQFFYQSNQDATTNTHATTNAGEYYRPT